MTKSYGLRSKTVACGSDADQDVLRKIAQARDATEYDSADPNGIQEVLAEVVSNFWPERRGPMSPAGAGTP